MAIRRDLWERRLRVHRRGNCVKTFFSWWIMMMKKRRKKSIMESYMHHMWKVSQREFNGNWRSITWVGSWREGNPSEARFKNCKHHKKFSNKKKPICMATKKIRLKEENNLITLAMIPKYLLSKMTSSLLDKGLPANRNLWWWNLYLTQIKLNL